MEKELELNPPYCSVTRLRYVFDLFSTHNFPQLTSSFLKNRGFSGSDAFQTMSALKFLGIIGTDGNKTAKMDKLQLKGDQRAQSIQEMVRTSYSKLFEAVEEPYKLSKIDLYNDFVSIYRLSARLANSALPNFLWLCHEAGFDVPEAPEIKQRKPRIAVVSSQKNPKKSAQIKTAQPVAESNNYQQTTASGNHAVEVGEFKLVLPEGWDAEETRKAIVRGEFKVIYEELTNLSSKLKKIETKEKGEIA